jgi:hypothetical protein
MNGGKTVLRAGYGIFYARLPSASVIRLQQRNGVIQKTGTLSAANAAQLAAGPVFPFRLSSLAGSVGLTNVTFAAPNLKTPYTEQADLTLEQAMGKNGALTVTYMHSRCYQFISREDLNLGPATGTAKYNITNLDGSTATYTTPTYLAKNEIDPRYASLIYLSNRGRIWYDGLSVAYRQRPRSGPLARWLIRGLMRWITRRATPVQTSTLRIRRTPPTTATTRPIKEVHSWTNANAWSSRRF